MGRLKCDYINWLITLTSDDINQLQLYMNDFGLLILFFRPCNPTSNTKLGFPLSCDTKLSVHKLL